MSNMTRRNFIGASSAAAGLALAATTARKAHGEGDKIRLGIIGTGARGQQHLREGLWGSKDFDIVAVADLYTPHLSAGTRYASAANAGISIVLNERPSPKNLVELRSSSKVLAYKAHDELLATENLDAVIIATPPHTHAAIIANCLDAGLHVFCESPMAITIEDGRTLVAKAVKSGLAVQLGHQRRYHPNYNLVAKYHQDHLPLGRLTHAEAFFHLNSHIRYPAGILDPKVAHPTNPIPAEFETARNWRLYMDPDCAPFLDTLPRSVDTLNWFCGTVPSRVYTSGGIDYWKDDRTTPDNVTVVFDYRIGVGNTQFVPMDSRYDRQNVHALNKSYLLRSTFSYLLNNRKHLEHERLIGDRATVNLTPKNDSTYLLETMSGMPHDLRTDHINILHGGMEKKLANWSEEERRRFWVTKGKTYDPPGVFDGDRSTVPITAVGSEESAEVHQFRAFADHIRNGGTPRANVMVGLAAVIAGESARRSYETGLPVDIDPALMEFDFETPSISMYDENAAPIPGTTELM